MSVRPQEEELLQKEVNDSHPANLALVRQDVEAEAQASNLTPAEKAVLLGHLVQEAMEGASFLGLRNNSLARTKWVRKELGTILPGMEQQKIPTIEAEAVNLEQRDSNSLSADIVLLKRDVNEACAWGNMTTRGKTVLLGLLTQNHIERATFIGLRSSPLTRATRVEERSAKKFSNTEESFYNKVLSISW